MKYFLPHVLADAPKVDAPSTHQLCQNGWDYNDHSCYYYSTTTRTWSDAESHCQSMDASLVVIEKDREFNYIKEYYRYHFSDDLFWIGLTDSEQEGMILFYVKLTPTHKKYIQVCTQILRST